MRQYNKVYLEITNRCNLRCSFCPGTKRHPRTMSPAEFRFLAERIRPATRYLYLHLMGEPLLHPALPELLQIAGELDFRVNITTNGTLLAQAGGVLLADLPVRKISISLHSLEANDGQERFSTYLEQCIVFARKAAAAGRITGLRLWNLDGATAGQNSLNEPILTVLHRAFPAEWQPVREGFRLSERIFLEFGERFEWPDLSAEEVRGQAFCYGLRDQFGVLCDGTVVPCCLDHEGDLALGNLFTEPLEEILSSPRARAIYEGFSGRQAMEELCRKCGYARRFIR